MQERLNLTHYRDWKKGGETSYSQIKDSPAENLSIGKGILDNYKIG